MVCAAQHSDRRRTSACGLPREHHRPHDHGARCPRGRRCSSIARAARRGITRTVDRPQHGLATSGGSSMRMAFDTFVGDATCRTFACELPRDPHRPQSDHGARCPTGAIDVLRSHLRRGITRTVAWRWFVRGARARSSSCRSFRRRPAIPDRKSAIDAATRACPTWGALASEGDRAERMSGTRTVCDSGRSPPDEFLRCMRFVIDVICRVATRVSVASISSLTRCAGLTSRCAFAKHLETKCCAIESSSRTHPSSRKGQCYGDLLNATRSG